MNERSPKSTLYREPFEWGPYRPLEHGEEVDPKHIVDIDGVPQVPCRVYPTNGHKPTISPETR